jgi:hypothetical protein
MGLFLPIFLLGLTVPTDQTTSTTANAKTLVNTEIVSGTSATPRPIDPLEDASGRDEQQRNRTCYTVRSYLFERRNGYAPELVGMTTCDPARASGQRHVRGRAHLVPAN